MPFFLKAGELCRFFQRRVSDTCFFIVDYDIYLAR